LVALPMVTGTFSPSKK